MLTAKEKKEVITKLRAQSAATKRKFVAEEVSSPAEQPKAKRTKKEYIAEQRAFALNPPKGKPVLFTGKPNVAAGSSATKNSAVKTASPGVKKSAAVTRRPPARKAKDAESQDAQKPKYVPYKLPAQKDASSGSKKSATVARKAKDAESQDAQTPKYVPYKLPAAGSEKSVTVARKAKDAESQDAQMPNYVPYKLPALKDASFGSKKSATVARKAKDAESQDGQTTRYTLFKLPAAGSEKSATVAHSPARKAKDEQTIQHTSSTSSASNKTPSSGTEFHDDNEQQPRVRNMPAKRSTTISFMGALVVLVCAMGYCFSHFGTLPTKTRATLCYETNMADAEDANRESWTSCSDDRIPLLPCPVGGRCNGGQFVGCANELMFVDGDHCSFTPEANATVAVFVDELSKLTVGHKCYNSKLAADVFNINMPLFLLDQVALNEDIDFALELMDFYNAFHQPPTFVFSEKSNQVRVGLTTVVTLSLPNSCVAKNAFVYSGQMFWFSLRSVMGFAAWCVRCALVFAWEVWWGSVREMPKTTIGATLFTLLAVRIYVVAARKQRLLDDIAKTEEQVLTYLKEFSTKEHQADLLRDMFKAKLRFREHQTRFVRLIWPNIVRRCRSNAKLLSRDILVGTYKGPTVVEVWKWIAIE